MPFVLYLLGLAVFAQATSEFMLSGLGPAIAADLGVSVPTAGWLTSGFAVGMVIGAPVLALLGDRWPRRRTLLVTLSVFLVVHVVGALTDSFGVLLATRVVAALANAGFLAVGLATATSLVAADLKGRAATILLGGTTLACVAGVPGGALLGQYLGWRAAFWAVALISLPAVIAIFVSVPGRTTGPAATRLRFTPRLGVLLLLGALVNGATFCSFTYLAPVFTDVAGLAERWVPLLLALFGLGAFAGVLLAGRYADRRPLALLGPAGIALLLGWTTFALTAAVPATVALVFVQGTLSFAAGSALITLALYAAADSPVLAGGLATASLNVGAALGPLLGGVTITAIGYDGPLWASAALVGGALVIAGIAMTVQRSRRSARRVV
ncbi:DHA1 family chloramphenicol resistance protein-like MFS transporter [Kribbella amoyensis]|uniref:DHA1 family chloramphenicol resistance protein-like MFS transporter n=1 Tax=Kribbella amoyensis TaxID=996641 RepID=A0A561BSG8_9ACTN|nr:Cmx/CmrA family chloramphenicol efflux MFS transporter [Kribbella amoyensis]TWD81825.1 DHA1 family chloramphenicol resistance protein-like MFS transporter [Kribbella amoyensis]